MDWKSNLKFAGLVTADIVEVVRLTFRATKEQQKQADAFLDDFTKKHPKDANRSKQEVRELYYQLASGIKQALAE